MARLGKNNQHTFSRIPSANISRSVLNRSCSLKTAFDSSRIIPIFVDEALPGDTINMRMAHFARLATPLKALMDNIFMDTWFFAVPYRLVWEHWPNFNGEQEDPSDSIDYVIPQMNSGSSGGYTEESIHDYFGIPTKIENLSHTSLFHRAYGLIWDEWFRDQDLQSKYLTRPMDTGDGPDDPSEYYLARRNKRHDYFSSARPWPQKGDPVQLSLGDSAPVEKDPVDATFNVSIPGDSVFNVNVQGGDGVPAATIVILDDTNNPSSPTDLEHGDHTGLIANLTDAAAVTVNQLREAVQIQKLYERDARGGTRYTEVLRSHFGVTSPDSRLQRPEYLGGGTTPVMINPITQTSGTPAAAGSAQGNVAAIGVAASNNIGFNKSFTEHCLIIGLTSVRADLTYQQGLERMWSRKTRFDHFWPALQGLGEQAILNKEIFAQGADVGDPADPTDDKVFGYQERYGEYRYKPSRVTGKMRSNATQSLDIWHLAQDFASLPDLEVGFIAEKPPIARILAVTDEPEFIYDGHFTYKCIRPMPTYGVPGMMDHF